MGEFAGRYVKAEYASDFDPKNPNNVDIDIIVKLKRKTRLSKLKSTNIRIRIAGVRINPFYIIRSILGLSRLPL